MRNGFSVGEAVCLTGYANSLAVMKQPVQDRSLFDTCVMQLTAPKQQLTIHILHLTDLLLT